MKPAEEYQEIREGLYCWQRYDSSAKVDLFSTALRVGHHLVFIDPILLAAEPLAVFTAASPPAAVILTNSNHERASSEYRDKFNIPVWTAENLKDGAAVLGELQIIHIAGAVPGEIAVYSPAGGGLLMMGDALIHLDELTFLPDKYCEEPKLMKASLQKLLRFRFDLMTFAHGLPIPSGAKTRLQELFS